MSRPIIIHADEHVACPNCSHRFPLSEGISRQAIEHHASELSLEALLKRPSRRTRSCPCRRK